MFGIYIPETSKKLVKEVIESELSREEKIIEIACYAQHVLPYYQCSTDEVLFFAEKILDAGLHEANKIALAA